MEVFQLAQLFFLLASPQKEGRKSVSLSLVMWTWEQECLPEETEDMNNP